MGGLGKCETKEDLTNSEKKESNVARNVETCTFGFNQIVKIQLFELKKSKSFSESLKKEEIFLANLQSNEKQAINSSSGELSNSNSYFLQNEWDIISESEKITKLNSAENISKIMDAIKNDGSMKESKSSANFSIKKNESLFSQNKDFNFKVFH